MVTPQLASQLGSIENVVALSVGQYTSGSLILMVSYGAHFAFILFFLAMAWQLAPRYRIVPIMSAVVMASAGLSLLREFMIWEESYELVGGVYNPLAENTSFTNAYRYGNWTITVPILLTQLAIAFGMARPELHRRVFGETGDFARLNIWGVISTVFFVWLIVEVRGVIGRGVATSPAELQAWPKNIWWYFFATWGLYPIAYALPQLGFTGDIVVVRQLLFSIADISSKLIYGIILSRYVLRRSALEGYVPAAEALETSPLGATVASRRGD